jgi:hypothetical protein
MTTPRYIVRYHCHVCGQMHLLWFELPLPGGPTEPCTLPEHYPDGNFPPSILDSLADSLFWCDQANDYIEFNDPTRIHLTPRSPPWPLEP